MTDSPRAGPAARRRGGGVGARAVGQRDDEVPRQEVGHVRVVPARAIRARLRMLSVPKKYFP
jgi:hypothetical protein